MPITFPNISIEEAKRQLQHQDRMLRSFPEVETVFGKVGRAETRDRSGADHDGRDDRAALRPRTSGARRTTSAGTRAGRPGWLKPALRPLWPEERPITWDELTTEMNGKMQFPGWTNAWTMPIKTRVDMLTTGVRTPIGIKVFGHRPRRDREGRRRARARCSRRSAGRAASSTSATSAGSTSTSSPSPRRWRATACASPTSSASSRARSAARRSARRSRGATASRSTCATRRTCAATSSRCARCWCRSAQRRRLDGRRRRGPMGTQGALETAPATPRSPRRARSAGRSPIFLAQNMGSMGGGASPSGGTGTLRPRLPSGPSSASDAPSAWPRCEPRP